MRKQDKQVLLLVGGGLLLVAGHKLVSTEAKNLGLPHVVGVVLIALAMRV